MGENRLHKDSKVEVKRVPVDKLRKRVIKKFDGFSKVYDADGNYIKTIIEPDSEPENDEYGTLNVAKSLMTRKSLEFIKGKRKINLRGLNVAVRKRQLLKALLSSKGVVTPALKAVGVAYSTYKSYIRSDSEFAEKVSWIKEAAIDFGESKLHDNMELGKEASIMFYLERQGRSRGYGRGDISDVVKHDAELQDLTDAEIEARLKQLDGNNNS